MKNDQDSLEEASQLYMQALGLVGQDQTITSAYKDVSRRWAALEEERQRTEREMKKREGALSMMDRISATMAKAQSVRDEQAQHIKERRALEIANRLGGDPTLRNRLHRLEEIIESKEKDIAQLEGRAASLLDQAVGLAPQDDVVRQSVADFYLGLMKAYEARGDLVGARMAENRCRMFDDKGVYAEVLSGQTWVRAASNQPPLSIQLLAEGAERTLEPTGQVMSVATDQERVLLQGRYLVRNALGSVQAMRLWRGEHLELQLFSPPANLPDSVAFIPSGMVIDPDGGQQEKVDSFALAKREVTCGEWLLFLNDPVVRNQIDEAERTGKRQYVPRDGERPLWPRSSDGLFRLPALEDGQAVDPLWPVSHISGRDVLAYAKWLGKRDQQGWRLPNHLEWVLAAQGGDGRRYPWGMRADLGFSASALGSSNGWWCSVPVASYPKDRSVQGVFDLGGSVAELVLVDGGVRLAAGGSHRDRHPEAFSVFSSRDVIDSQPESGVGFRLALTIPTSP
jgi:hypothetical protein